MNNCPTCKGPKGERWCVMRMRGHEGPHMVGGGTWPTSVFGICAPCTNSFHDAPVVAPTEGVIATCSTCGNMKDDPEYGNWSNGEDRTLSYCADEFHGLVAPTEGADDLREIQNQVKAWQAREFRPNGEASNPLADGLVMCEEAGEVARCLVKGYQNIRGGKDHWDAELRKEVADVVITALALAANNDFDLRDALAERWAVVGARRFATKVGFDMTEVD